MVPPPRASLGLPRSGRLRQSRDFQRLRSAGRRVVSGCLVLNWAPLPPATASRLGVVTSGKLGQATVRSRSRRLLREAFRLHQHHLNTAVDAVLVARASIVGRGLAGVERDYVRALRQAGLWQQTP